MLKSGDKVERKDGENFSDGKKVATIDRIEYLYGDDRAWLKGTGTYIKTSNLKHASNKKPKTEVEVVKDKVKKLINEKKEEIKSLEDDIKKLGYVIATLEDIND
jgi:hypothetical protein